MSYPTTYHVKWAIGASNCVYCELMVNDDYKGLYIFSEKIKIDKNRVNLVKLTTTDNEPPEVTGWLHFQSRQANGRRPYSMGNAILHRAV